jgi:hypothetical protein
MLGTSNFRTMQVSCAEDRSSAAPAASLTGGWPSCDVSDRLCTRQGRPQTLFSAFQLEFDDSGGNGESKPAKWNALNGLFTVECGAPLRQWVYAARRAALVSRIRAW